MRRAGLKPQDALRKNEPTYREDVAGKELNDRQLVELMARYPELLARPIVLRGKKAVLARPIEKSAELNIE